MPALHVVFDGHWWNNYVPPTEDDSGRETIDARGMSDEAVLALFN